MKFFLQLAMCTFRTFFAITVNLHVSKVELRCRLLPVKHDLTIFPPNFQSVSLYESVTNVSVIYFYYYQQYLEHNFIIKGLFMSLKVYVLRA